MISDRPKGRNTVLLRRVAVGLALLGLACILLGESKGNVAVSVLGITCFGLAGATAAYTSPRRPRLHPIDVAAGLVAFFFAGAILGLAIYFASCRAF